MTRVLIVDDHEVVRLGLGEALTKQGFDFIEFAGSVKSARSKITVFNPDAAIIDLNLPDGSGFEIVQWLREISSEIAIVILSLNSGDRFVHAAKVSGANAYLSKAQSTQEIVAALSFALSSPHSFSSRFSTQKSKFEELTAREFDVLFLLAKGSKNSSISTQLFISPSTVKTHISSILRKLSAENRTTAVRKAQEAGLLTQ